MWIGAVLALGWLILLLRFPARALPISLAALLVLFSIAGSVLWLDHRHTQQTARLMLHLSWSAECPPEQPLRTALNNQSDHTLLALTWQISAEQQGQGIELTNERLPRGHFRLSQGLASGKTWQACLPLPRLRDGVNPTQLSYQAHQLHATFAD
ncbi:multidrug transporter [Atopomonas sediminilitoris]|uniref:multidrug transporter n=1 Tax=Atopomonas sediminilitoris TaxID=2919919 RepID=UPI001F4E913F|nr:multidrug transporter [Atopomonas sediminilitoris]MCJ8169781.1 multidrug transporter [Atopomonas sediminilitoris]